MSAVTLAVTTAVTTAAIIAVTINVINAATINKATDIVQHPLYTSYINGIK